MTERALVLVVGAMVACPGFVHAQAVVRCDKCHADRDFLRGKRDTDAADSALYVPTTLLADTRHASLACSDCHRRYDDGYPHRTGATTEGCETCHDDAAAAWARSIHADTSAALDAPTCITCHGVHEVRGPEDPASPIYRLRIASLCGACHSDPRLIDEYFQDPRDSIARVAVQRYVSTVHGTAMSEAGLVVSATCSDCHRAHDIQPAWDSTSSLHPAHLAQTCGTCHEGLLDAFAQSAHGTASFTRDPDRVAPTCIDCHSAHDIVEADDPEWFVGIVEECGSCHERVFETYLDTYHGQVTSLGFTLTAKCSDCHTAHAMLPADDPASTVHPTRLVETCGRCHEGANANFVRYYAHGDPHDRERYPLLFWPWAFMTTLLVGVWSFFGLHTLLWLTRVGIERAARRRQRHRSA